MYVYCLFTGLWLNKVALLSKRNKKGNEKFVPEFMYFPQRQNTTLPVVIYRNTIVSLFIMRKVYKKFGTIDLIY
jgi:hypothetical protein